jgi:hypothetical protein
VLPANTHLRAVKQWPNRGSKDASVQIRAKRRRKKKPMEKADLGRAVVDKAGYDLISSGF